MIWLSGCVVLAAVSLPTAPVSDPNAVPGVSKAYIGGVVGVFESVSNNRLYMKIAEVVPQIVNKKVRVPQYVHTRNKHHPYKMHIHPMNIKTIKEKIVWREVNVELSQGVKVKAVNAKKLDPPVDLATIRPGQLVEVHLFRTTEKQPDGKYYHQTLGMQLDVSPKTIKVPGMSKPKSRKK